MIFSHRDEILFLSRYLQQRVRISLELIRTLVETTSRSFLKETSLDVR